MFEIGATANMDKNPRREKFYKTATELLSEKGYKAMTMRELAERLDCDKSNIYNYIKSKQELLDQLLFEIADKFHTGISEIEESSYSAAEKLKAIIRLHVTMTFENPNKMNIHAHEWRFLDSDRQKIFVSRRSKYEKKITDIIQIGMDEKSIKQGDVSFIKNCILSSLRWMYTWKISEKKKLNPIEIERTISEFIFNGISNN